MFASQSRCSLRHCTATALTFGAFAMTGCSYFPESSFTLAEESRLPKWFVLESGQTRADVKVTMDYYLDHSGRTATFTLINAFGFPVQRVTGQLRGLYPHKSTNSQPGFPEGYPSYEVISVGEQVEIIEHRRMEPIFRVSDDPAVRSKLGTNG